MTGQTLDPHQHNVTARSIPLTATLVGDKVVVSGNGSATLPKDSGAHRFDFTIISPPGMKVTFTSLDTEDDRSVCPPSSGDTSQQIVGVTIHPSGDKASFTNNNNNKGTMDVCYQWHFSCSDASKTVEPFDPVIKNGGTT